MTGISEVFSDTDTLLPCSVLKEKEIEKKSHFQMNINISVLQLTGECWNANHPLTSGKLVCK
jgi:hypothetical protein